MLNIGLSLVLLLGFLNGLHSMSIKRSESTEESLSAGGDPDVQYDAYPIVFSKRAAMLLDRLMVALHHALEDDDKSELRKIKLMQNGQSLPTAKSTKFHKGKTDYDAYYGYKVINGQTDDLDDDDSTEDADYGIGRDTAYESFRNGQSDEAMDLQRRGHAGELGPNKGRVYWRCYFNAVSCF